MQGKFVIEAAKFNRSTHNTQNNIETLGVKKDQRNISQKKMDGGVKEDNVKVFNGIINYQYTKQINGATGENSQLCWK